MTDHRTGVPGSVNPNTTYPVVAKLIELRAYDRRIVAGYFDTEAAAQAACAALTASPRPGALGYAVELVPRYPPRTYFVGA